MLEISSFVQVIVNVGFVHQNKSHMRKGKNISKYICIQKNTFLFHNCVVTVLERLSLSLSPLSLVGLWWRGDSLVLYFFPSGDGCCTRLCLVLSGLTLCCINTHMHVQFQKSSLCHSLRNVWHIFLAWFWSASVLLCTCLPLVLTLLSVKHSVCLVWLSFRCVCVSTRTGL